MSTSFCSILHEIGGGGGEVGNGDRGNIWGMQTHGEGKMLACNYMLSDSSAIAEQSQIN